MQPRTALPAAFVLALAGACTVPTPEPKVPPEHPSPSAPAAAQSPVSAAPTAATADGHSDLHEKGEKAGIHNFAEVAPRLFRGAQPEGEESFAFLANLGVKAVLSVDGARPDVEGAAKHGIRYIHVPIEYSGITREEQVRIAKAAREVKGGLFVHCHHGKHRGPAASGIAWMAREGCPAEGAVADMKKAGTDPKYEGLYADVMGFQPVSAADLAKVRPEDIGPVATVPDFIEAMVRIDATFDRMKAVQKAGWKTPAAMPDVRPAHEARILAEHYREVQRLDEVVKRPEDFRRWMAEGEKAAWSLEEAIRSGSADGAKSAMDAVNTNCNSCHATYRNKRKGN